MCSPGGKKAKKPVTHTRNINKYAFRCLYKIAKKIIKIKK